MSSVSEALRVHGPEYLRRLPVTAATVPIRKAFGAIMRCRTGELGVVRWQCARCQRRHWTGRSCGNRHCPTCGQEKTNAWIKRQQAKLMPGVHHFMITFTVPQPMRDVMHRHRREGYSALMAASADAIRLVASATRELKDCELGFFGVLHTWGRDPMVYHPHVHYVVPGGGVTVDEAGQATGWKSTSPGFFVHHGTLVRVYKAKLADQLRSRGLYDLVPSAAWQKKFVVDIQAVDSGRSVVDYLAPYVHRVAISNHRVVDVAAQSVTYQYKPTGSDRLETRTVSGQQFAAGLAQHILPTGLRKVRHHGWMSNHSRVSPEEVRMLVWAVLGWVYWMASGHAPRQTDPKPNPPRCRVCGSPMRVTRVIDRPLNVDALNRAVAYQDTG